MITYNPKSWIKLIFHIAKSDTLYKLWPQLIAMGIIAFIITYLELKFLSEYNFLTHTAEIYSLIGFSLSLLLVFRTNTAYDRWWEGRKKWGELLNNSRQLSIKIAEMDLTNRDKAFFRRMICNFAEALKENLRKGVKLDDLDLTEDELTYLSKSQHIPNSIVQLIHKKLNELKRNAQLSEVDLLYLDINLNSFLDVSGACERIRNTPIPYSYSMFLKKFIFIYVVTVPIAFVSSLGYGTIFMAVFVFYVLVSIEILAEELEDPFGQDDNDLPLDDVCLKITSNSKDIFNS
jgi:putative membrane protein